MEMMKAKTLGTVIVCSAILFGASLFGQASAPAASQTTDNDVATLKAQLGEQQKQIDALKSAMLEQRKLIEKAAANAPAQNTNDTFALPRNKALGDVASTTPIIPSIAPVTAPVINAAQPGNDSTSPLQLKIGDAYITPVGFMDFTSVFRNHDAGNGIGTNFAGVPYGNVYQNNLTEERLSMQNSRFGFRVDADVLGAHVIGYMEDDFLGNNATSVAVTSNSNTVRSRLYWVDLRKGAWELMAGQSWSLLTPGREGISPLPANIFYSQNIDTNYQAGLVWARIPELRLVGHFAGDKAAFALALDQAEGYIGGSGGSGIVAVPSALSSTYVGGELNNAATTVSAPNVFPDLIAKLAFDPVKAFHLELGGILSEFRVWNPTSKITYTTPGGGGFINANFALAPGFRILTNNFWSDGDGRYIFGLAPDLAVTSFGSPSLIHSGSTVDGFEWTIGNTLLYAYYGGVYIGRDVVIDTTGKTPALAGWGYTGSSNTQNRSIQELTLGFNQTIWKDPKYGALNFMGQYSYVLREPWYVANNGSPKEANLNMVFLDLRYTLPGSAPTIGH
jgi:hypothetical protein